MFDYRRLEPTHHLSSFLVRLPLWNGNENPRRPFEEWKVGGSLPWYQAYNSAKHSRHEYFEESNLRNMLDAVCGLVAILAAQFIVIDFGQEHFAGPSSTVEGYDVAIGGYFEVKFPDDWPPEERYDFDWGKLQQDPHPFQNLTFVNSDRFCTACHEAGHVVVAWCLDLPLREVRIQLKEGDSHWSGGATVHGEGKHLPPLDQAAVYAAGIEAQKLVRCETPAWQASNDRVNILNIFADDGVHEIAELDERRNAAHARARQLLAPHVDKLTKIATELDENGHLSAERLAELLGPRE
jgi:hypothetical protein